MKKFLLLLLGLTIAVGASADVNSSNSFKSAKYQSSRQQANGWLKRHQAKDLKAANVTKPKSSANAPTLIYDQPEGEVAAYMYSTVIYDFSDNETYNSDAFSHFVYAPDGETVYMQVFEDSPWMTATISGNKIHLPLGQYIWYDEDYEEGGIIAWGTVAAAPEGEEGAVFVQDNTVTEVTFTIQDDVITMDNSSGDYDGIGAVGMATISEDGYCYYVEWGSTFTLTIEPTVITEQPEGDLVSYTRKIQGIDYYEGNVMNLTCDFNVVYAPDGQTAYVQDPVCALPEGSWVQGTVNNNKITVPLGQFIYFDAGFGEITAWGTNILGEDGYEFIPDNSVTSVTYTIDNDGYVTIDNSQAGVNGNGATGIAVLLNNSSIYFAMEWNAPGPPEPITEQPEGQLVQYVRHGNWIYESGSVVPLGGLMDVVFAPDGQTVYIKDPIDGFRYGTWVKGTLDNGIIDVPVGQILSTETKYNTVLMWGKMALSTTYWIYEFTPYYNKPTIQYAIDGDNIYMIDGSHDGPTYFGPAAMMEDIESAEGVEFEAYYTLYDGPKVIYDQPAGDLVTYIRSGSGFYPDGGINKKDGGNRYIDAPKIKEQYGVANVVFAPDGQTVYLQDPVFCGEQYNRGTWVRGTLSNNGTKIHVPLGQYVSWDLDSESGDMLAWGSTSLNDFEDNGNLSMGFMPDPDLAEVTYTIANGCISLDYSGGGSYQEFDDLLNQYYNGEIDYETLEQLVAPLFITSGLAYISSEGYWTGESNWGTFYIGKHPATLPDPVVHNWYDAQNENGNSRVDVEIPTVDTDGMPIFMDALSYSIYTDNDELFTFDASRYNLDEDVTEVTYDMWQDSWRLDPRAGIRFFRTNAEGYEPFFNWRIGIQFHYTVDGVKNSTNIVYLEVFEQPNTPGDVNGDGSVSIKDVTALISMLMDSLQAPVGADVNGDGEVNIKDVTALISNLMNGN